jgi:hypothetical protein
MNHATRFARLVLLLALVGALALAGCGGSESGSPTTPMTETSPTPYEMAVTNIAAADTADAAQAAYDAVKDDVTATEGDKLQTAVDMRIAALATMDREAAQKMALMTAAGNVDTSDLMTAEGITAAKKAIYALKMALADAVDVSDADKATHQATVGAAETAVMTAQTGMDLAGRMAAQRTAITDASTMAQTAVAGMNDDSTDSEVAAAGAAVKAVKDAIAAAEDLPEDDATIISAKAVLGVIESTLAAKKTSRMTAVDDQAVEDRKAMAKTGKAMHAALAGPDPTSDNALDNLDSDNAPILAAASLTIDAAEGAGSLLDTAAHAAVVLEAGDSAGALGSWNGMNYAHTDDGTKVMNAAVVYTNKGPEKTVSFAEAEYTVHPGDTSGSDRKGYVFVADGGDVQTGFDFMDVMAKDFTHSGIQTHMQAAKEDAVYIKGTYDGAPGEYRCTGICTSTNDGKGSPSGLGGTWHFKPDAGAMVSQPDADYLFYGWWVSKDKDGLPTAASAFAGKFGADAVALPNGWTGSSTGLAGSAAYAGNAAGKFALSNPLDSTGDGGHFTADATLNAKFSGTDLGITGTIDNFMANDKSVPWSVSLHRAGWGEDGEISAPVNDVDTADVDESMGTTWSIDGNSAGRSGTWSGQTYDEMPGNAPNGDGSNIPTTVTGTFYSEFSTIGRIVGAFGADKQ